MLVKRAADRSRRYGLARPLSTLLDRLERTAGNDPAERLAVHRAFLAAGLEAMDANLGSHAVAELLEMSLLKYVAIPWRETGVAAEDYCQDLCELLVWESYALTDEHETTIFERIPSNHGDLVASILDALGAEYRRHGLKHQACRAAENAANLAVARGRLAGMVHIAETLGPDGWIAVKRMAEAALAAGRRDIALALFAAADRPDTLRDNLRRACLELLDEEPAERPHLRLVR